MVVYCGVAWGGPGLLCLATILLDSTRQTLLLRPRLAETRCWFRGNIEILLYFYGPIALMLLINLGFFFTTVTFLSEYSFNTTLCCTVFPSLLLSPFDTITKVCCLHSSR